MGFILVRESRAWTPIKERYPAFSFPLLFDSSPIEQTLVAPGLDSNLDFDTAAWSLLCGFRRDCVKHIR